MAYKGRFRPTNPKKYKGDYNNCIYRSLWERSFFKWCDNEENVISWSSEEIVIPYISPIDGKQHRYFVDVFVEYKEKDGSIRKRLIEIKPYKQTLPPEIPQKKTRRFLTEVKTYGINQAKWQYARAYCDKMGWEFMVLTEKDLFKKGNTKKKS